jgi:HAD superfamily hydrolase (TIGR01509 family)
MIKAILMDFNGIIINDEPLQMKAYQETLKGEGIDLTEEQYFSADKAEGFITQKTAKWRDMIDKEIPLFDGVENFIRKMEKEFALGMVSMGRREEIEYVLERIGLRDCFSSIVSAEDVTICKPDPECYLTGFNEVDAARTRAGHHPITHGECLVIEDAPPGIAAGNRAGLKTLGVTNTVSEKVLREAGADAIAKNIDDWFPDSIRRVFV